MQSKALFVFFREASKREGANRNFWQTFSMRTGHKHILFVLKVDHCRIRTRAVRNASKGIMRHVGIVDIYRITIGAIDVVVWCGL